jgi:hypothetical protein
MLVPFQREAVVIQGQDKQTLHSTLSLWQWQRQVLWWR